MTTNDELLKLIALGDKATARPWVECACGSCGQIMSKPVDCEVADLRLHIQSCEEEGFPYSTKWLADATYITAAANLAPEIARELIEAREALAKANEDADALDDEILTLMRYVEPGEDYYRMIKKHVAHRARIGGDK